jgi:cellulase
LQTIANVANRYHDNRGDDIIDGSHQGPITVYIAPAASQGSGAVWTKIAESGLSNGVWAVDTLRANGGKHSVTLPSSLAAGDYLLRAEIIAHHESDTDYAVNSARGAQFYPSCSQVTVKTGGSTKPPGTFNFIGGYTSTDPGILFNLYGGSTSYSIPGPAVWDGAATDDAVTSSSSIVAEPTTSVIAEPTTSTVAVPTTTSAAPVVPTTSVAAPVTSTAPVTTAVPTTFSTKTRKTSTTKAATTSVAAPIETDVVTYSPPAPTTTKASATRAPKSPVEINKCLDEVNACIRQAQSSIGGIVNLEPCESRRASCY